MSSYTPAEPTGDQARRALRRAHVLAQVGDGAYYVTSAAYLVGLGWSAAQVGSVLGVAWGLGALAAPWLGRLADARGLTRVSAATTLMCALALALVASAVTLGVVLVGLTMYAVAQSAWGGQRAALVSALSPPARRVPERARLQALGNAGIALGTVLGGAALLVGDPAALRVALGADALGYAVVAVTIRRHVVVTPGGVDPGGVGPGDVGPGDVGSGIVGSGSMGSSGVGAVRAGPTRTPRQWAATAAASALYLYLPLLSVALPLLVATSAGMPGWVIAACFGANTLGVSVLQTRVARTVTTARRVRAAALGGGALLALSALLLWRSLRAGDATAAIDGARAGVLLAVAVLVQVLGEVHFAAAAWDLGYRLAPAGGEAAWQSTYGAAIPVARCLGPALLAPAATSSSGWLVPAVAFGLGALALAAVVPVPPRPNPHLAPVTRCSDR